MSAVGARFVVPAVAEGIAEGATTALRAADAEAAEWPIASTRGELPVDGAVKGTVGDAVEGTDGDASEV